ncbi:hypothetical protein [Brevundimonas naejangsanensis]|uniref:hypothetical protein n=1 Tax=Brevundimonas naejangsanensis TaxID=588932 RepID=UPI0004626599|nr:hypothetical protein [Brevundimonas naejangsanensis]
MWEVHDDPRDFHAALDLQIRRHGENSHRLHRAIVVAGGLTDRTTLAAWRRGLKVPQTPASLKVLDIIEHRYQLETGYLRSRLQRRRALSGLVPPEVQHAESRRLAWHLPDDFDERSAQEREEILAWVRSTILSGGTAYHRYHSTVSKHRFALRFDGSGPPELAAPAQLRAEMDALLRFKSATLTNIGYQRSGVWGAETAAQREEHLALLFGALAALPDDEVSGLGVPRGDLTFGLLVLPSVWDWYVQWRERRRGFYTGWESEMLLLGAAFSRSQTGWLRQSPWLADRLRPIPGLVGQDSRSGEPCREYRKITEEILRRMPEERRYPRAAAEAVRSFLMLRLGLHLGVRQKNLRQLQLRPRGSPPTPERELEVRRCGELRWSEREGGWEVFIPCVAFKNSGSAYFSKRPFRLLLPDLGGLYRWIDAYVGRHRPALLNGSRDPGTFFVKTVKTSSRDAAYNQHTFYSAWRQVIQRYGIYNPYTGRGAIPGLLPHGPHNVRDVLATHVLKLTGSYEQASYAIQDTPATVADHYGRFLPQDKAALAAQVLNRVWEAA